MNLGQEQKWRTILDLFVQQKTTLTDINIAIMVNQLAKIESFDPSDGRFGALLDFVVHTVEQQGFAWIGTRQLSDIVQSIAKLRFKGKKFKQLLHLICTEENAESFIEDAQPRNIAIMMWSFAKLHLKVPGFCQQVERNCIIAKFFADGVEPQSISLTAWALGKLGLEAPKFFAKIEESSTWFVANGRPQEIANTVWACAKLGFFPPNLLAQVEKVSSWLVANGIPQNISNTIWSFAQLDQKAPMLCRAIDQQPTRLLNKNTIGADIGDTTWALSKMNLNAPMLLAKMQQEAEWVAAIGRPCVVRNVVRALKKFGYKVPVAQRQPNHVRRR